MNLVPAGNRLIVRQLEAEDKSPGGIIMPDRAKEKPNRGKVLAVGDRTVGESQHRIPDAVKEGSVVVFYRHCGHEVRVGTEDLLILSAEHVMAIEQ
jgi:chaperonin GroES